MPDETNEYVTRLINEGKITPFSALQIGEYAQRNMEGWSATESKNYQFDDSGREGFEFPDAEGMRTLLQQKYPKRDFTITSERNDAAPQTDPDAIRAACMQAISAAIPAQEMDGYGMGD